MSRFTVVWLRHGKLVEFNYFNLEYAQEIKGYLQSQYSIPDSEICIRENAGFEQAIHVDSLPLGELL